MSCLPLAKLVSLKFSLINVGLHAAEASDIHQQPEVPETGEPWRIS